MIDVAAIEDNRMFVDGLRAWAGTLPDIRLAAVTSTVDELLRVPADDHYIVLLNLSGMTLESTASSLGISPETAKTYLKRVKAKYREAGLPAYTKLDLAERVRADCSSGTGKHPGQ